MVVLAQVLGHFCGLGRTALDVHRSNTSLSLAYIEALSLEALLYGMGNLPAFCTQLVTLRRIYDFHTLDVAQNKRHRKTLGVHLAAHIVTQIVDYCARTGNETAYGCHGFGKCTNIKVNAVHAAQMF